VVTIGNFSLLLAGSGQVGSRHLQGLAKCSNRLEIHIVDPVENALRASAERWDEVFGSISPHVVSYHKNLQDVPSELDLVIVATTSSARPSAVEKIASHARVGGWLLEKVLAQSESDLNRITNAIHRPSDAWVNTWARTTPWYKQIRAQADSGPVTFGISGGSWGLACNCIHILDLMAWWTGEDLVDVDASELDPEWLPSRRAGNLEISGSLTATYSGGSTGSLFASRPSEENDLAGASSPDVFWVESPVVRWEVDSPFSETVSCALANDGRQVHGRIEYQSERTAALVDDLLETHSCGLPDLSTSANQHRILLDGLLRSWRLIGGEHVDRVPIT